MQGNAPQLRIQINRPAAARFGIYPQAIDDTLDDAFGQRQVGQYYTQTNSYFIILEVLPDLQKSPATLGNIYVKASNGQPVPLSTLVDTDNAQTGPLSVSHQGQFPAATLSFNLRPGVALGQAVEAIHRAELEMNKPQSLVGSFQGNARAFQTSLASEPILIVAALLVVYVILGVLYESYIHPLTILSTLPSAGVGALLTLWGGGFDLSVGRARPPAGSPPLNEALPNRPTGRPPALDGRVVRYICVAPIETKWNMIPIRVHSNRGSSQRKCDLDCRARGRAPALSGIEVAGEPLPK